jgi:hypothetical protein
MEPEGPEEDQPAPPVTSEQPGKAGAAAFVRYYIELLNYAAQTGDVQGLRDFAPDCRGCGLFADLYEEPYARGGYFEGYKWRVINLIAAPYGRDHDVLVGIRQAAGTYLDRTGAELEHHKPRKYEFRFTARYVGDTWRITDMVATS